MSLRKRLDLTGEPLYLMDGSAFIYRGFYAFQNMARSDGFPTNVLYIVSRLLLRLWREEQPKYFAFVFDGKGKSFRSDIFSDYKAQRSSTPEPLIQQLAPLREFLELLGVPFLVGDGHEADDCIASLAEKFHGERPVVIIGADKDLRQCLRENVVMWDPSAKEEKVVTLEGFRAETGMEPSSWPDYQALIGDSSDNIPGVPQVGPKTAMPLMAEFPKLENLYDRLPAVPPKVRKKLEGHKELAFMCRQLTTLDITACAGVPLEQVTVRAPRLADMSEFLQEYELRALAKEMASMERVGNFTHYLAGTVEVAGAVIPSASSTRKLAVGAEPQTQELFSPTKEGASSLANFMAAGEQGSLLQSASAEVVVLQVDSLEDLPACSSSLALLSRDDGFLMASGDWQRFYTGADQALADFLCTHYAGRIIGVDVKALWEKHPALYSAATGRWFDLALAAYLLNPEERSYSWTHLLIRFGEQVEDASLAGKPGLLAIAMAEMLQERMQGLDLMSVFSDLESELTPVLFVMEQRGVAIDKGAFTGFLQDVQKELHRLTKLIYEQAGRVFNIRSSQQLADVLFTVLGLPQAGKTKGGAVSTSQESLEKLKGKHPIIEEVLQYRVLEKLRSTYLEPMPLLADKENRIHTTFNQMATATGRLSSSNPNLQNIPIRGQFGERMRSCFVASSEHKLIGADYSQIELRVLAHLSQEPTLLDAFHHNQDIHSRTAGLLFDMEPDEVTSEQRRNAKTINFGLIYGMGAQKLAQELGMTVKEAKGFIERYFARLGKLKEFYDSIEEAAKQQGYVATMTGRRRLTPDINSANTQLRSQARRQAINARIQGSAADIIKLAMLAVEKDLILQRLDARLLLQIHDELVLEVPAAHADEAAKRVVTLMESIAPCGEKLSVPLLVDCCIGTNWGETH